MAKALKAVVKVVGAVASVLAVIPGPWQPIAAIVAVGASIASVGLEMIAPTKPKPPNLAGSQTQFRLDPNGGIPYMVGRTFFAGNVVHRDTWGTDNEYHGMSLVWSGGGPIDAVEAFQVDRATVGFGGGGAAVGGFAGFMWLALALGTAPQAIASPVAGFPGYSGQLSGYAAGAWVCKFDKNGKKFPNGVPQAGIIGRGVKVYDPRKDSTYPGGLGAHRIDNEATWEFSENPWLHGLTWALGRWQNGKRVLGVGMAPEGINIPSIVDAANVADANGWKVGGMLSSTDDKWEALKSIAQAGGGQFIRMGAQLTAFVNAPRVAIATITQKDIVGRAKFAGTQPIRSRINRVVPQFRSEAHGWEVIPAAPVEFAEYVAFDGDRRTTETAFGLVQDVDQVAELAAYEIVNARELGPIDLDLSIAWMGLEPGDAVNLDLPDLGFPAGTVAIVMARGIDPTTGFVAVSLKTETPGKHALALGKTTTVPATPSLVPRDLSNVRAPGAAAWALAAASNIGSNGETVPILRITGAIDNPAAEAVLVRYRPVGSAGWIMGPNVDPGATGIDISGVQPGTAYEAEIAYRQFGVLGAWRALGQVATGAMTATGFVDGGALAYEDAIYFNSPLFRESLGGAIATLEAFKTSQGTAAAIAGQGPGATAAADRVLNNTDANGILTIKSPVGGQAGTSASEQLGAIVIQLPLPKGGAAGTLSGSMVRFFVDIFEYQEDRQQTYEVGGYYYPANAQWINCSARLVGSSDAARPVRFGTNAGWPIVAIGEIFNGWSYPQVKVRDVQVGYANLSETLWATGWTVTWAAANPFAQVDKVIANPVPGDFAFGANAREAWGGPVATLPGFKTSQGTAAAIAGQGALATRSDVQDGFLGGNLAVRLAPHPLNSQYLSASKIAYVAGQDVEGLKPYEGGANITANWTAAGIAGQGAFATRNSANWGEIVDATVPAMIRSGNLAAGGYGKAALMVYNDGLPVQDLRPYEGGANVTANWTAAGIAGQGVFATRNSANWSEIENGSRPLALQSTQFFESGYMRATGVYNDAGNKNLNEYYPEDIGSNRTEGRTAAAIAGQGYFATQNYADFGSRIANLPAAIQPSNLVYEGQRINAGFVLYGDMNSVDYFKPQDLNSNRTEGRTAAAIAGQGALATRSDVQDGFLGGALAIRLAAHPLSNQYLSMATIAYPDGANADLLKPGEAGANVTESRTAASIAGQGPGATAAGADVLNYADDLALTRIPYPQGGVYNYNAGEAIGRIRIVMPDAAKNSYSMVRFHVDVYNYDENQSATYVIGGYIYNGAGELGWINRSAQLIGPEEKSLRVTFGYWGGRPAVTIGFDATSWQYPQVFVRDFIAGYSAPGASAWKAGWSVTVAAGELTNPSSINRPRAGDAIFGEGVKEGAGGAIATLPNFKTSQGTAAAFAGQTAWATYAGSTGKVSQIQDNGRAYDGRFLNSSNNFGLRALSAPPTFTGSDAGGSATISIGSDGIFYPDWGGSISLPSATIPGLSYSTTYYIWRNQPDPSTAGTSYGYSTSIADALGTGKAYLGFYTTPAAGGSGGGGGIYGGTNCVAASAFVPSPRTGKERLARNVRKGGFLKALSEDGLDPTEVPVDRNGSAMSHCVTIETESGIRLTLAQNTPMTTAKGGWIIAANVTGHRIPVEDAQGFRYERVRKVRDAGLRVVAKIACNNGTFAAGDESGRWIYSHNPIYKP